MSLLDANLRTAPVAYRTMAEGLAVAADVWKADQVRRAVALDQYRGAIAARALWTRRWMVDPEGFQAEHLLMTGHRDVFRLLAAIQERETFWERRR